MNARENPEFANERYTEMMQAAERRALHLPQVEPRTKGRRRLYRSAAHWLARRRASRAHCLLHLRTTPTHGD